MMNFLEGRDKGDVGEENKTISMLMTDQAKTMEPSPKRRRNRSKERLISTS